MSYYVMGTGSRSLVKANDATRKEVMDTTRRYLIQLREEHSDLVLISGMAEGWDELIAVLAIELSIPFLAYVPHPTYGEYYWGKTSYLGRDRLSRFRELLGKAAEIHISSDSLYVGGTHANFIRNADMVNKSDFALVYDKNSRGTRDAVMKLTQAKVPYDVYPFTKQGSLFD